MPTLGIRVAYKFGSIYLPHETNALMKVFCLPYLIGWKGDMRVQNAWPSYLAQCFLTIFGFVHTCNQLLHFHSPYGERTIDVTLIVAMFTMFLISNCGNVYNVSTVYNVFNEFDFCARPTFKLSDSLKDNRIRHQLLRNEATKATNVVIRSFKERPHRTCETTGSVRIGLQTSTTADTITKHTKNDSETHIYNRNCVLMTALLLSISDHWSTFLTADELIPPMLPSWTGQRISVFSFQLD